MISVFDQKIPIVTRDVAYGANAARLLQSLVLMKKPRKGGLPPVRHDPVKKVEKWIKLHEFVPRKLPAKVTYIYTARTSSSQAPLQGCIARVETGSFVKLAYTWLNTFDVHLALQGVSNPIGHDIAH